MRKGLLILLFQRAGVNGLKLCVISLCILCREVHLLNEIYDGRLMIHWLLKDDGWLRIEKPMEAFGTPVILVFQIGWEKEISRDLEVRRWGKKQSMQD